jgi:hypothetical protein
VLLYVSIYVGLLFVIYTTKYSVVCVIGLFIFVYICCLFVVVTIIKKFSALHFI